MIKSRNILIGAYNKPWGSLGSGGAAYHFDTAGNQIQKLGPPEIAASDQFGYAVAISGDTFVVGVRLRDTKGTNSGSACIFFP